MNWRNPSATTGRLLAIGAIVACTATDPVPLDDDASTPGDTESHTDPPETDTEQPPDTDDSDTDPDPVYTDKPIVIIMIGDGMGDGQREAASRYAHGDAGQLALQALPNASDLATSSLSGVTDSAASATAMASGHVTHNLLVGMDRHQADVESLTGLAKGLGMAAGVVTTASIAHATPAAFTAHQAHREEYVDIAADQVQDSRPEVALGGGYQYFAPAGKDSEREDDGLLDTIEANGCTIARTADEMLAGAQAPCLWGFFAAEHMTYISELEAGSTEPTLAEMTAVALDMLDRDDDGFLLMVEGARIDHGGHGNELINVVEETLAFDEAVAHVVAWAAPRPRVTVIVTADHECGGLDIVTPAPAGTLSEVTWEDTRHTNRYITAYGSGPGTEVFDGTIRDHTWTHAIARAAILGEAVTPPVRGSVADGRTDDLRHAVSTQARSTNYGVGYNQLDALSLDADGDFLFLGIDGVFERDRNAVTVLLDVDLGDSTGFDDLDGAIGDFIGRVDNVLRGLEVSVPYAGFGAELAVSSWGAHGVVYQQLSNESGLRGLTDPLGDPEDLAWLPAAGNFAEPIRSGPVGVASRPGEGFEVSLQWLDLYPELAGGVPPDATIGLAVLLTNELGVPSNQLLPPLAAGDPDPDGPLVLPGIVRFQVDSDGDGVADGNAVPEVVLP